MAEARIKRKIVWEKSGVSEIIGTILMLSITVVLFSGIITMVGTMPAPRQSFTVELKCSLHPVDASNWGLGVNFTILHQGGQVMDDMWTVIYIAVDDTMLFKRVSDGLNDFNNDGKWNVGEHWNLLITRVVDDDNYVSTLSNNSTFSITIVDQERNTLVWHETLGQASYLYAPIIQRAWIDSDIATSVDVPGPISFTDKFKIYAEVRDPNNDLDRDNIWVNLSSIYGAGSKPIQLRDVVTDSNGVEHGHPHDDIYLAICDSPPRISIGYYYFTFNASSKTVDPVTNRTPMSQAVFRFPVGLILKDNPQIVVRGDYIRFSNNQPTNGDTIQITATIQNLGGVGARVNVSFYVFGENFDPLNPPPMNISYGWVGNLTLLVPQVGERDARISWTATPGGNHTIWVTAWPMPSGPQELPETEYDNFNRTNIIVMPKILLVDDDGHPNDLSAGDTVSVMRASLEAADFNYHFVTVGAGDGPAYSTGDYPLRDYDVVIWMTGYKSSTLTTKDMENLGKYLTGEDTFGVGGSLWLISQGFWKEASTAGEHNDFANEFLHVPLINMYIGSLPKELFGNELNNVTDYFTTAPINTEERVPDTDDVYYWRHDQVPDNRTVALTDLVGGVPQNVYALTYDSDAAGANVSDSRILTQTWGFSRISDTATQAQYAYKAILWLGNIEYRFTEDLAISSQTISRSTVFYKQPVTISFTIRNNGFKVYEPGPDRVEYLLRIYDSNNYVVREVYERLNVTLGIGNDNTVQVDVDWTPETLGHHRIWIMVDPFNLIEESNTLNNVISSYWGAGDLNVRYRTLLIDGCTNGAVHNETHDIALALDRIGLQGMYDNFTVDYTDLDEYGPPFSVSGEVSLDQYNAVIWVAGVRASPLASGDIENLKNYTENGGNLWLIGTDFDFTDNELRGITGVSGAVAEETGDRLRGLINDPIAHGMDLSINNSAANVLVPDPAKAPSQPGGPGAVGFISGQHGINSVRYHRGASAGVVPYRAVTTAWLPSNLTDSEQRAELVFMILRWFDRPEEMPEARITDADLWLSTDQTNTRPQIGSGYVIRAVVHNVGGATANVLVRFMDGHTQIGSNSISVSPGGRTTAEMIWVPLFAGHRTLSVLVDPINEVDEIFDWSNNVATRSTYVYFFWDNMESGAGKWTRGSTIMRISGEGPLEYFHETELFTNVVSEWDPLESYGYTTIKDTGFYHSFDTAYWLQEPPGGNTSIGTRSSGGEALAGEPAGPTPMATISDTRYMRSDLHTVNGLNASNLGLSQSESMLLSLIERTGSGTGNLIVSWGIQAWVRTSAGIPSELTAGTPVAQVSRSANGEGLQVGRWTPTERAMELGDAIVVRVYSRVGANPWAQQAEFITETLGSKQLNSVEWRVNYYTSYATVATANPATHYTRGWFHWGASTHDSRIERFTYVTPPHVLSTVPAGGAAHVATDMSVRVTFNEPMNTAVAPLLVQTVGVPVSWTYSGWDADGVTAVWTHSPWNETDNITLQVSKAQNRAGIEMEGYHEWTFTTATGATATATGPKGISNQPNIIITYSFVKSPEWVNLYYTTDGGATWNFAGNDTTVDGTFAYTITTGSGTYHWYASAGGGESEVPGSLPPVNGTTDWEGGPYVLDMIPPEVSSVWPPNGAAGVHVSEYIVITFNEPMNTAVFSLTIDPYRWDPSSTIYYIWNSDSTRVTVAHKSFDPGTIITVTINLARDVAGNNMEKSYTWKFETDDSGGIDWTQLGRTPDNTTASNRGLVTEAMDLRGLSSAKLTFWHKYNLLAGVNGGFLQVGYNDGGTWKWRYVVPANAYTGNLKEIITDDFGNNIQWCWNGVSGRGTFGWDFIQLDLLRISPSIPDLSQVRVKFNYMQWGNGTGYGWYIDDVTVAVTRLNATAETGDRDLWELVPTTDRFGQETTAWRNVDPDNHNLTAAGIDNYLMTQPIDLTNARRAELSAYLKFNFNTQSGGPPDGFRIEVSKNNGITWEPINLGVRASWGVSGTDNIGTKTYTGVNEGYNWVNVNSLTRVTTDLSPFSGHVIHIRFRLVTNGHNDYLHYEDPNAGFGGFYIDDVEVTGETILT